MDLGIAGGRPGHSGGLLRGRHHSPHLLSHRGALGLRLGKTKLYGRQLLQACANGSSELMSNISSSIVSILYNLQLMRLIGETGVAAYSVMMYVDFVFIAAFLGFSVGSAPIVSFHYGADNRTELKSVFRKSAVIIGVTALVMVTASELLSHPLSSAFVGYDPDLLEMTVYGFRLFALNYLFCGVNIYASSFFTALCNGLISALISFARTLLLRAEWSCCCPCSGASTASGGGGGRRGAGCPGLSGLPDLPAQTLPLRIKTARSALERAVF